MIRYKSYPPSPITAAPPFIIPPHFPFQTVTSHYIHLSAGYISSTPPPSFTTLIVPPLISFCLIRHPVYPLSPPLLLLIPTCHPFISSFPHTSPTFSKTPPLVLPLTHTSPYSPTPSPTYHTLTPTISYPLLHIRPISSVSHRPQIPLLPFPQHTPPIRPSLYI